MNPVGAFRAAACLAQYGCPPSVTYCVSLPTVLPTPSVPLLQFTGRDVPSTVISFAQKTLKDGQVISKLHVIELGVVPGTQRQQRQRGCCVASKQYDSAGQQKSAWYAWVVSPTMWQLAAPK